MGKKRLSARLRMAKLTGEMYIEATPCRVFISLIVRIAHHRRTFRMKNTEFKTKKKKKEIPWHLSVAQK